jgi:hypothetical protein
MMKKIAFYAMLALVFSLPASAGYYQMVDHLPNSGGVDDAAVSFYHDASSATDGIAVIGGSMPAGATNTASHYLLGNGWSGLGLLPFCLNGAAAASVGDTVYCHGGWDSDGARISNRLMKFAQYIYDWDTLAGYSLSPRMNHGLVKLYGQYLYAVGGSVGATADSTVERLSLQGGPPIYVKAMPQGRKNAVVAAAMGGDSKPHIYVIGGMNHSGSLLSSVIEYDSTGYPGTWVTRTIMPGPARWQAAGAVVNNKIYVMGGIVDLMGTITRRVDIYDPATNAWSLGDSLPEPLCRAGATGYGSIIYIFGGFNANTNQQSDSVWAYHPIAPNPPLLVLPMADAFVNNTTASFTWRSVPDAGRYRIQVSTDPNFYTIDILDYQTATNMDTVMGGVAISPEGDFYWRVKSYNLSLTDSSLWSPVRKLTLDLTPPDQPIPSTPSSGMFTNNMAVNFNWFAVDSIMSYHLQAFKGDTLTPVYNVYDLGNNYSTLDFSPYGEGLYLWRVEAKDSAGNFSGYHSVQSFTVDQTSPYVVGTSPYTNQTLVPVGQEIVVGFSEPMAHAFGSGTFNFTCSPDPGGWSSFWNTAGDTVTLYHNYFSQGQSVTFTVTAADDRAGNNLVSSFGWNFTIASDYTPPTISTPYTNSEQLLNGNNYLFQVQVTDDVGVDSVVLYWAVAGKNGYDFRRKLNLAAGNVYDATIYSGEITMQGIQYRVEAWDLSGNITLYPGLTSDDYYIHSVRYNGQYLSANIPYDVWLMLSLPSNAVNTNIFGMLSNDLGSYNTSIWRLFEWAGGGYQEIKDFANGWISDFGRAYWLRHRWGSTGPITVYFEGVDSSYGNFTNSTPAQIFLDQGWNDVGSPFQFDIPWGNISHSASTYGPYAYNGSTWLNPSEVYNTGVPMQPFKGYSFRNDLGSVDYLSITPMSAKKKQAPAIPDGWQALIRIENSFGQDNNYFGIGTGASEQRDHYDYPEPPSALTGTSGYFRLARDQFCTDIRPELGDGQTWDFAVSCNGQTKVTVDLTAGFPAGTECYLADLTRQISVDLRDDPSYSFTPESGETVREFKIVAGKTDYAKAVLGSSFALPTATLLLQNRPNPFRGTTEINYQLAAGGPASIRIYNISGQLVRTLVDRNQMAGRYTVRWDGRDDQGRSVTNGVYFYRLTAPGITAGRRLVMVK